MSISAPKVSIVSISYNQEKYISEALQGFLDQKTSFDYEIIVADDASTDATPQIIKQFTNKYPEIIKPILRTKNIGIQANLVDALKKAKGLYIALCEGDDFWTDPNKLEEQVNFLDNHPKYALCFHPVRVLFEGGNEKEAIFPDLKNDIEFNTDELIKSNFIQTNSVMYRRLDYDNIPLDILPLDWYLHLYHSKHGKIGIVNKVMSTYRRQPGGVWWDSFNNITNLYMKYGVQHLNMYFEALELFKGNKTYEATILNNINNLLETIIEIDVKEKSGVLESYMKQYPERAAASVLFYTKKNTALINEQASEISKLRTSLTNTTKLNQHYKKLLTNPVYYTKFALKKLRRK